MTSWIISLNAHGMERAEDFRHFFIGVLDRIGARIFEESWSAVAFDCEHQDIELVRHATREYAVVAPYEDLKRL
ncbi:MAG: hypothetical protein ABL889_01945 [Terricaulis sp.]